MAARMMPKTTIAAVEAAAGGAPALATGRQAHSCENRRDDRVALPLRQTGPGPTGLARPQEHPAHGALHRTGAGQALFSRRRWPCAPTFVEGLLQRARPQRATAH